MNTKFLTACFILISIPSLAFSANGKPFAEMQAQIDALNTRLTAMEANTSTNTHDISQIIANANLQSSRILDNRLAAVEAREDLDAIESFSRYLSRCVDLKLLALGTFEQLLDEKDDLQDGGFKQVTWFYYSLNANNEVIATEQTETLDADAINEVIKELDALAQCNRNEADFIRAHFSNWDEKQNQLAQQLATVLRVLKDILRIGVGGSDLGDS